MSVSLLLARFIKVIIKDCIKHVCSLTGDEKLGSVSSERYRETQRDIPKPTQTPNLKKVFQTIREQDWSSVPVAFVQVEGPDGYDMFIDSKAKSHC